MEIKGWKYYNHAAVPTCAPHEMPDLTPIKDGTIWKIGGGQHGRALLARWTEDWDCGYDTGWWYIILDKPFDISKLNSNRRYKITKGARFFEVKTINANEYQMELENVTKLAYSAYPVKYRPQVDRGEFERTVGRWQESIDQGTAKLYAAFFRETGEMCGYICSIEHNGFRSSSFVKSIPAFEKYQVNAAMLYKYVIDSEDYIKAGGYLENGSRTINHETAFNDYLEKYFGYRKAYCELKVKYRPGIGIIVTILYFFRDLLKKIDGIPIIHLINSVIKMEEIVKRQSSDK